MSTQTTPTELGEHFAELVSDWKSKSKYMSNSVQMPTVWSYQQIIGMGQPAIPLILAELQREADHWFWALEAISGENPVAQENAGDVSLSAKAWLDWGRAKGLI